MLTDHYVKACLGKKCFDTYQEAARFAYPYITPSNYIGPYRCVYCGKYHNGHRPKKMRTR